MQYFGAILLHSQLDQDALRQWYDTHLCLTDDDYDIRVSRQETPVVFEYQKPRFRDFEDDGHCWCVILARCSVSGFEENLWEELLNCDIRGH